MNRTLALVGVLLTAPVAASEIDVTSAGISITNSWDKVQLLESGGKILERGDIVLFVSPNGTVLEVCELGSADPCTQPAHWSRVMLEIENN